MARVTQFDWQNPNVQLELNLAATIIETDACIEWAGDYLNERPILRVNKSTRSAPRLVYQRHFGEISQAIVVINTCKNLRCVNPRHLKAVSRSSCAKEACRHVANLSADRSVSRKS